MLRARIDTDVALTPAMQAQLKQFDDSLVVYRASYLQTLAQYRLDSSPDPNADTRADAAVKGQGLAASGLLGGFQDILHNSDQSGPR